MIESLENLTTAFSAEEFWPTENVATRPLKMSRQNESFYYFHDGNKNVTALTDEIGNLVQNYNYKTFGAVESSVSVENSDAVENSMSLVNPFQFSSEYYDSELNLVYYNYRHYDPETGRWETKSLYNQASPGSSPNRGTRRRKFAQLCTKQSDTI